MDWYTYTSQVLSRSAIQFQKGLSLPEFQRQYGTVKQCEAALEKARWPEGYQCPRCQGHEHGLVYDRRLKRYQCRTFGHHALQRDHPPCCMAIGRLGEPKAHARCQSPLRCRCPLQGRAMTRR